jgi:hypothetical protein
MTRGWNRIYPALLALVGVPVLIAGYAVNAGPPSNDSLAQMVVFGAEHHSAVMFGGWLQIAGTVLCLLFALYLVQRAGASSSFAGVLTLFGCVVLTCVGLAELTGYAMAASGDATVVRVAVQFIPGVQHGYSVVAAPMVFLPLGAVILTSGILPRAIGYGALAFGVVFASMGPIGMLAPVQGFVDALSAIQGLWWIAAAIALIGRAGLPQPVAGPSPTAGVS